MSWGIGIAKEQKNIIQQSTTPSKFAEGYYEKGWVWSLQELGLNRIRYPPLSTKNGYDGAFPPAENCALGATYGSQRTKIS